MARPAENILEDILDQLQSSAGNGVQQQTYDDMVAALDDGKSKKEKRDLKGAAQDAASTANKLLSTNAASDATSVLAGSFKSMGTKILPGFGTAISLAADAVEAFYTYMNENLQQYQQLNTAGIQTTNGMMGLQSALATGRLSLEDFMSATESTRDVIAGMGADGAQQFGSMLNEVMKAEQTIGSLNMTNQQMGKYLASNLKMQKSYGVFERLDAAQRKQSNIQYMEDMNKYSKSLGMSTDALMDKLNESTDSVTGFGTQLALSQRGMDPNAAADTANNLNSVLGSFGDFGGAFNEQLARFIEFGQVDLETPIGQMFQNNDQIRSLFEKTRQMALDGSLATEAGAKQLQTMMSSDGLVQSIDGNMTQFRAAFGDTATNQIIQWRNQLNNYNADVNKVDDFWNNTMNSFNRTIENMFFGFKKGVADMFIDPRGFIKNMFGDKWGSWLLDGAFDWDVSSIPLVGSLTDFLTTFFKPVSWFWEALQGYGDGVSSRFGSIEQPSWQNIVRALVPDWLADIIFDQAGDIASPVDMGAKLVDGTNQLVDDATEWMAESGKAFVKYEGELAKTAYESASSMFDSISTWWNKPSSQTVIQNTVTKNSKTIAAPVPVDKPSSDFDAQTQLVQAIQQLKSSDSSELLVQLIDQMRRAADATEQQVRLSRKAGNGPVQIN